MVHEALSRPEETKESSDRNFGLMMAGFFALVGLAPIARTFSLEGSRWWSLALAIAFGGLALFWTAPLSPLSRCWLKFSLLVHKIVSPIALALLFYVSVVPVGLLMRALGKDPLRLRRDPETPSYWIRRTPPGPAPDTMKNQF